MSLYHLWSGRFLQSPEDTATYLQRDAEFFIRVAQDAGHAAPDTAAYTDRIQDIVLDGATTEVEPTRALITAMVDADAAWNRALAEWLPFPGSQIIAATQGRIDMIASHITTRYGIPPDRPQFLAPDDLSIDGRPATTHCSYLRQNILADILLNMEWYLYVARKHGLPVSDGFSDTAREESAAYFTGQTGRLPEPVARMQRSLLTNAARWLDDVCADFGISSWWLRRVRVSLLHEAASITT